MIPIRDHNPSYTFPFINHLLILANTAVFIHTFFLPDFELDAVIARYALIPSRFEISDLITSQFLHGGIGHLISNMLFLHIFGENLEDTLGHLRYLFFYLTCGIVAGLGQFLIAPASLIPIIGASGAIAGLMGGYLYLFPKARIDVLIPVGLFFTSATVPAYLMLLYWIIAQFMLGLGSLGIEEGGVAYFAHISGFIAGLVLIRIIPKKKYNLRLLDSHRY